MSRYSVDHKQATHQRILETAGRRLKQDGIDGSGIATLMRDAGLTNGAFYAHFSSKEDLVAATIAAQLDIQRLAHKALAPGRAGLEQFVRAYLSVEHRDDSGGGCPSAALLDEIRRCPEATRQAYSDGMAAIMAGMGTHLPPGGTVSPDLKMFGVFASMVGTLQLSRAIADVQLADAILEQGIRTALALIDE